MAQYPTAPPPGSKLYAPTTGTQYGPAAPSSGRTTSNVVAQRNAMEEAMWALAMPEEEWPYAPGYRPVLRSGKLVQSNEPGLFDAYGKRVTPQSGGLYYNLESDPRMLYGSRGPAGRELLLRQLVAAGFLDEDYIGDYRYEINALEEAMDFANSTGLELSNALSQRIAGGGGRKRKIPAGPVRVYQRTSSEDLISLVKTMAQDVIGRELTNEEAAGFVPAYQQQEVAFQSAAYGGGVVTEPPSPQTAAMNYIKNQFGREESAYAYLGYMNMLFDSVGAI